MRAAVPLQLERLAHSLDDAVQVLHCARQAFQAGFEGPRQLRIVAVQALLQGQKGAGIYNPLD